MSQRLRDEAKSWTIVSICFAVAAVCQVSFVAISYWPETPVQYVCALPRIPSIVVMPLEPRKAVIYHHMARHLIAQAHCLEGQRAGCRDAKVALYEAYAVVGELLNDQ